MSSSAAPQDPGGGVERRRTAGFDVHTLRQDFPILSQKVHGKPLVYLDSAASTQKPRAVIDAVRAVYEEYYSNVHRGVHQLSIAVDGRLRGGTQQGATISQRRSTAARSCSCAAPPRRINLVAHSFGRKHVRGGDEVLITALEHHSNIVPWQLLCDEKGAHLRVAPINDRGEVILEEYERLLSPRTKLVAVAHISNALGTVNPVARIVELAHGRGVPVLVDGAQAVPRLPVDVQALGCDFYAFSGHKTYGPSGIGALYGRAELLEAMPPYQGGGDMILSVTLRQDDLQRHPLQVRGGHARTSPVAIGLGAALDYLSGIGLEAIEAYEDELLAYASRGPAGGPRASPSSARPGRKPERSRSSWRASTPTTSARCSTTKGVAIRTGHHCAQPVMARYGVPATARASLGLYNTREEIDVLVRGLRKVREVFA